MMNGLRAALASIVGDPDMATLSARQLDLLLRIYAGPQNACTVRGMADAMNVSKPAISRALDRLGELGFAERQLDVRDHRSIIAVLCPGGRRFVEVVIHAMCQAAF